LQHTHIVPLYSVTDFPERALRGICLPYFGGATLSRVLESLAAIAPAQRKTADIVAAVQTVPAELLASAAESPRQNASAALHFLETATYEQAICWMGACLADGLHEAHERGLVHLDLKPSNVLWAGDGQPMLLDFHLAREPVAEGRAAPDWLGGTPGYMPPEQEAALDAVRRDLPISSAVDRRADIYALGRVLSEALAGALPPADVPASDWLRRSNPLVSAGLADLIAKCLSAAPEDRYAEAAVLAADLRRHLNHLPLAAVKNRSLAERWSKWRRRRPHALLVLLLGVAACGAGLLVAVQVRKQFGQAEIALEEGRNLIAEHRYAEATSTLRQGLGLTEPMYRSSELSQQLEAELRMAERAQAAQELHQFIDRTRVLCSSDGLKLDELRQLESQARRFWNLRRWFVERITAPTPWELMRRRRMDVLDLAILWTGLRVRLADEKDKPAAHRHALEILTQAETLAGESGVLWHARRNHAVALKMDELAKQAEQAAAAAPPTSAWEYAAAGHALWEAERLQEANAYFEEALRREPQSLWVNFCYGRCAHQLGRWEDAAAAFTACVSLAPASGWCFYNRGRAWIRLDRPDRARNDFDRALSLDATLTPAALDRGRLNLDERRWSEAAEDFQKVLDHGGDPAAAHYGLAVAEAGQGDRDAARTSLQRALQFDPQLPEALSFRESLDRPQ
jgi:tetratricopeptide (TPR) repeat protein